MAINPNMSKSKIFNDPVYGFVSVPYGLLFNLVEHPWFQRLRRIKQVSLTHYVYPGALHTRFHHALGALHLMQQAIEVLRSKGAYISDQEAEAVSAAILLHDIGHGPFSHTLEHTLVRAHHEDLSLLFMEQLNQELSGALDMAIQIFRDQYPKRFLHQLVSGQLDMDRMDYLNRDSFFTGVHEGVIGYDRIIKMLAIKNDELVVEEKGIYSIEKFLIARRLMYWQVYLHKTVLSAEQMLVQTLRRAKDLVRAGELVPVYGGLAYFLHHDIAAGDFITRRDELLGRFAALDDHDITFALKTWMVHPDPILAYLSSSLVNRKLFRLELRNDPFEDRQIQQIEAAIAENWPDDSAAEYLMIKGKETNSAYTVDIDEIKILFKTGEVRPMSMIADHAVLPGVFTKYYLGYPKSVGRI